MSDDNGQVATVRHFNRFYTKQIGLLREGLLSTPYSLSEARVLYELGQHEEATATTLSTELGLDMGYLSRMLKGFRRRGLVDKRSSEIDRRQNILSLTPEGERIFSKLNEASDQEVRSMLSALPKRDRDTLIRSMRLITEILAPSEADKISFFLRPHRSGDMGWVVQRHGRIYNDEYGWNQEFEALVAEIAASFIRNYDPKMDRCWIAEKDGENVGSVFVVKHPEKSGVARLRLLLVEPKARGLGIGKRLVRECTLFARDAGYQKITLWTNSVLAAARSIYVKEGYELTREEPHQSFGDDLVGQTWEKNL